MRTVRSVVRAGSPPASAKSDDHRSAIGDGREGLERMQSLREELSETADIGPLRGRFDVLRMPAATALIVHADETVC
jgi:hypothetical protein